MVVQSGEPQAHLCKVVNWGALGGVGSDFIRFYMFVIFPCWCVQEGEDWDVCPYIV